MASALTDKKMENGNASRGEEGDDAKKSVFSEAGSSTAEILLHLKSWFELSPAGSVSAHKRLINTMGHVVRMIVEDSVESKLSTGVGMCIQQVLSLLADEKIFQFRASILEMLRSLVIACLNDRAPKQQKKKKSRGGGGGGGDGDGNFEGHGRVRIQLYRFLSKTVTSLVECYEKAVKTIKEAEMEEKLKFRIDGIESLGLLGMSDEGEGGGGANVGVWGWDGLVAATAANKPRRESSAASAIKEEEILVKDGCLKLLTEILIKSDDSMGEVLQNLDPLPPLRGLEEEDDLIALIAKFLKRKGSRSDEEVYYMHLKRFLKFCVRHSKERESKKKMQSSRSFGVMLALVEEAFARLDEIHGGSGKFLEDMTHYPLFYNVLKYLSKLCKEENDISVKIAASRTFANISHFNWTVLGEGEGATRSMEACDLGWDDEKGTFDVSNDDCDDEGCNAMMAYKVKILKNLGYYAASDCAETALVALGTVKKVISTKSGSGVMALLREDDPAREILLTISSTVDNRIGRRALKHHGVAERYISGLFKKKSKPTCWEMGLWKCEGTGSDVYEEWIKKLVTSIILCVYWKYDGKSKEKDDGGDDREHVEGLDEMLMLCGEMASREAGFAEAVFPVLVLDMLEKGGLAGKEGERGEWMVGSGESHMNRMLTRGFGWLIYSEGNVNVDALALAVDTFDSLRQITKQRFLAWGGHTRNIVAIKGKVYPNMQPAGGGGDRRRIRSPTPEKDYKHNEGLGEPVQWNGMAYGIVLRLDGLAVAKACLRAKRPCSALMYLETYCDNVFGGSTECLKGCGEVGGEAGDISGYGQLDDGDERARLEGSLLEKRRQLKKVFQEAYDMLGEEDAVVGVGNSTIGLDFERLGDHDSMGDVGFHTDPWRKLKKSDMKLQGSTHRTDWKWKASVGEGLKELGLNHVLGGYLQDTLQRHPSEGGQNGNFRGDSVEDLERLQEMWHEGAWRAMNWVGVDGEVGVGNGGEVSASAGLGSGFHAKLHESFLNILQNDRDTLGKSLLEGKKGITNIIGATADGEGMLRTFLQNGVKLWSLEEIQQLGEELISGGNAMTIVESWVKGIGDGALNYNDKCFIDDVREVGTR